MKTFFSNSVPADSCDSLLWVSVAVFLHISLDIWFLSAYVHCLLCTDTL